jgi:Trp operon repressor
MTGREMELIQRKIRIIEELSSSLMRRRTPEEIEDLITRVILPTLVLLLDTELVQEARMFHQ